jgi:hypothetical protein
MGREWRSGVSAFNDAFLVWGVVWAWSGVCVLYIERGFGFDW